MYNRKRPYQCLTTKALIDPHHITCVSLDISILNVKFKDQARAYRVDTPTSHQKQTFHPSTKVSSLFDELFDNNASDNALSLSASLAVNKKILEVILMPGNNAIIVAYQINACCNTDACDGVFHRIN